MQPCGHHTNCAQSDQYIIIVIISLTPAISAFIKEVIYNTVICQIYLLGTK